MKKNNILSLLAVCLTATLFLASCEGEDYSKDGKNNPRFRFKVLVDNPSKAAMSPSRATAQQEPETFTFNIGEDNDCEITCAVTDMDGYAPTSATRGMPVGTTVGLTINGTPFAAQQSNPIESANAYGTAGISITAYHKDNKGGAPAILTPNSKASNADTENNASVSQFKNLTYTWDGTLFGNTGSWDTESEIKGYYWHDDDSLSFFTYAPTNLGATYDVSTRKGTFTYTNPTANASQKDVLIGATPFSSQPEIDEDADGVNDPTFVINVNTYHALCAVRFVVDNTEKGTAPNYTQRSKDFKITSIELTNMKTGGTCTYTYSADPTKRSADCIAWSNLTGAGTMTGTYNQAIAKTNTAVNLHATGGSPTSTTQQANTFLLIPQELAANCKVTVNYTYDAVKYSSSTGTTTYIPVPASITGQLVGAGATKDASGNYTSYGSWEPGKMYTYVISSKYIKREGTLFTIDGTISYTSDAKHQPNRDDLWRSITDFADPAGTTPGASYPGNFSIDVSDIKYIELVWSDITTKFVELTVDETTAAHIWLEGTTWNNTYKVNGTAYTGGKSTGDGYAVSVKNNGTGVFHYNNPANNFTYPYAGNGNSTTQVYTDVYVYENLIKANPSGYSDGGSSKERKWVFDVRDYQTIKIPVFFYNDQTGGGSCKWSLTNFTVTALETEPW